MKDQREIQIAWEVYNLIEKLNYLLWDRYEVLPPVRKGPGIAVLKVTRGRDEV